MNKFSAMMNKKFLGLKGLYWVGIFVAALAVYALLSKTTAEDTPDEVSDTTDVPTDDAGTTEVSDTAMTASAASAYSALAGSGGGTVVVTNTTSDTSLANSSITSNVEWTTKGVAYLISKGTSGTVAQSALSTYLVGKPLSTAQTRLVDQVIAEYGMPPYADEVTNTGSTGATRTLVRYVKRAGADAIFAQYTSPDSLYLLDFNQWKVLSTGQNAVTATIVPVSDPIWEFPTYDMAGNRINPYGTAKA